MFVILFGIQLFLVKLWSRILISNLFIFYLQTVVSVLNAEFVRHMENSVVTHPGLDLQFPERAEPIINQDVVQIAVGA